MTRDPWTDPDPQPGDLDAILDGAHPVEIEMHPGNPDAKLSLLVTVEGEDVARLERMAAQRGRRPGEVISELLRTAS